ncbi:MAG TPA: DUF1846 domain-containing protein [Kiritimatiellia bacterium]|nr:DUF1846 domain-containing protein [Kiritimatiellia bacterium]HPS08505.1 DUF1846 domain-containing protein [Kiritimatiellia bacterium]
MNKIGFDNDKYLSEQTEEILRRAEQNGNKLYLEFGGKLMHDMHAARVLPGYDPNVKLRLLQQLKDKAEILLCIFAGDIERKKMRADFGISYDTDALKLIDGLRSWGLLVRAVVITRFSGQHAAKQFRARLEHRGVKVYYHYVTQGYPADVDTIVSEEGYGANEFVETERPIVVVTGPGPGSGKLATCLTQLYHERHKGRVAGYAKFETFPVWNLPLEHPVNVAYEAATVDLNDCNMVDPYHLQAYNKATINYNRDVDAFPLLRAIWEKMTNDDCPYKSPTDMGVNRVGFGIIDDAAVCEASKQEVIRRYFRHLCEYASGQSEHVMVDRVEVLMHKLKLSPEDRILVKPARQAGQDAMNQGKGRNGIFCGAAVQLKDGRIVVGKNSEQMHAAASMVLNAIKVLSGIPDQIHLIAPQVVQSIVHMKHDILKGKYTSLNLDEALIGLAISCATNPAAQIAMERLIDLRDCEMHMTHIITPGDEAGLRRLGLRCTSDPFFASSDLFIDA